MSAGQREAWEEQGFFFLPGFVDGATLDAMVGRVSEIAREVADGDHRPDLWVNGEGALADRPDPADRLSKVFRLMRTEEVFRSFATDPRLLAIVGDLLGTDVDCFLSQFIFKHPGALGQPWHQDNYYFRLEPTPQVGVWLACTAATLDNGPLWVAPGSHREAIHDAVPDSREHANLGYVEIVGADVSREIPVLMEPGDVLVFHSHLRHRSTDNRSATSRAAMVYHYAAAASVGHRAWNQDWVEVLRDGRPVMASDEPVPITR
ncbi:phytanoyl-CoA dioxygenase family protein [Candidatus Poriferisocius sp.]|uniref:phytanoyl-CoA dioxygenase family protein n=1 Tax=Candidatus Poriferisocius sp. TaxID=3101276 RepID=UPI003B5D00CA